MAGYRFSKAWWATFLVSAFLVALFLCFFAFLLAQFGYIHGLSATLHEKKTARLAAIFAAFIALQFAFAGVYFVLYLFSRENFSFAKTILDFQTRTRRADLESAIDLQKLAIEILSTAKDQLGHYAAPYKVDRFTWALPLTTGELCRIVSPPQTGMITPPPHMEVIDREGRRVGFAPWLGYAAGSNRKEWAPALDAALNSISAHAEDNVNRLATFSSDAPDVWSYWDFLYFSTVTQTTLGFGDILPNRTISRMVVVLHLFVGYGLLIVALNAVLM